MSILFPDAGRLSVLGRKSAVESKDRIGYLPEERGVYRKMKVGAFLAHMAGLKGVTSGVSKKIDDWLDKVDLGDVKKKRCDELSKGMQQKIQFISSVIHEPELLILDEPFSGLDPINQDVLEEIVRDFHSKGTTILFSTHLMHQAEQLCERVCLISKSKKVLDADLRELKTAERKGIVAVEFEGPDHWIRGPEIDRVEEADDGLRLILRDGADHQPILHRGVEAGARFLKFDLVEPRLHEIFIRHAGADAVGDAGMPTGVEMGAGR